MQFNAKTALFLALVAACATCAEAATVIRWPPSSASWAPCPRRLLVLGAAYGTAKSGVGIASMGVMRPELVMKSIVPVVMAGVLGIYGLIIPSSSPPTVRARALVSTPVVVRAPPPSDPT